MVTGLVNRTLTPTSCGNHGQKTPHEKFGNKTLTATYYCFIFPRLTMKRLQTYAMHSSATLGQLANLRFASSFGGHAGGKPCSTHSSDPAEVRA